MRTPFTAAILAAASVLAACEADAPIELRFDRAALSVADHPFPTDLYRDADTGVLLGFSEAQIGGMFFLNHLALSFQRGWSTATPIRIPFTAAPDDPDRWVDPAYAFDAVRVYRVDVDPPQRVALTDAQLGRRTGSLTVRTAPLAPGRFAVVALAGRLWTRGGLAVTASADYRQVQRDGDPATDESFQRVAAFDADFATRQDTLAYFEFTTTDHAAELTLLHAYVNGALPVDRQGADETVDLTPFLPGTAREIAASPGAAVADSPAAVAALFEAAGFQGVPTAGIARVTAGQLSTPNFVSDVVLDPLALVTNGTFLGRTPNLPFAPAGALGEGAPANPLALSASAPFRTVPYLAFWPEATAAGPIPVVVGLHGFATFKETWLGLASAITSSGRALVVIDNYQHGARADAIDVPEGDFAGKVDAGVLALADRRFPDPFLNPTFPARTRDKVRQSLCDQLSLVRLLAAADGQTPLVDLDGDGAPDAFSRVELVGTSLGAMMGLQMLAVSPVIAKAVLNVPGGGLPAIVRDAPNIDGDVRMLMLATANVDGFGLLSGTTRRMLNDSPEREIYDIVLQTVVAPIDPMTYAPHLLSGALRAASLPPGASVPPPSFLMQFVAGDLTVPNSANARLARAVAAFGGPDDLPHLVDAQGAQVLFDLGLPTREAPATDFPRAGVSQFRVTRPEVMPEGLAWDGGHKALWLWLDPATTAAMQSQAVRFLSSGGAP